MLLKVDAAQLEWRVKVFLAQDKVGMQEIEQMEAGLFDIHTDNQHRLLQLGEHEKGRVYAKNFIYQMIFQDVFGDQGIKAAGYGFASKADFMHVFPGTQKQRAEKWTEIAEAFFKKYAGIYDHSVGLIRTACTTGSITVPSGRFWTFKPELSYNQDLDWPRTKILNYPVQGFSADLVQIARLWLWENHFKARVEFGDCLLINTVHDDIEADVDNNPELVYNTCIAMEQAFRSIPEQFEKWYGSSINVPMAGEVKFGWNLNEKNMVKFKPKTFEQDYRDYIKKHGTAAN
jgi:hypothetical protein